MVLISLAGTVLQCSLGLKVGKVAFEQQIEFLAHLWRSMLVWLRIASVAHG